VVVDDRYRATRKHQPQFLFRRSNRRRPAHVSASGPVPARSNRAKPGSGPGRRRWLPAHKVPETQRDSIDVNRFVFAETSAV
jgi:hypothetical protein